MTQQQDQKVETDHDEDQGLSGPRALSQASWTFLRSQGKLICAVVIGLVVLEVGLRAVRPDMAGLVYGPVHTGGHPIVFSDTSFRIPEGETTTPPPPTILALGDSTTFGTGVGAEETWPLLLGGILPSDATAANAGFPGGGLRQFSQGLDTLWADPTPPEIVLLLVTGNMVSFTEFRGESADHDPLRRVQSARRRAAIPPSLKTRAVNVLQSSTVWKALSNNIEILKYGLGLLDHRTDPQAPLSPLLAYGWTQLDLPEGYDARMWDSFRTALQEVAVSTRAQDACLVIGFLPPRFMLSDKRSDNLKFVPKSRLTDSAPARISALAAELDAPFVDMTAPLQQAQHSEPLYIPGDYTHLSATGHGIIAQQFKDFLEADHNCNLSQLQ